MQNLEHKAATAIFDATNKPRGLKRLVLAFANSLRALKWLIRHEAAFRQELVLITASLPLLALWDISVYEKALLLVSLLFVLFAEIVNTAIEAVIDRISYDLHPLSGLAKDMGSLGVTVALLIAAVCWCSVLLTEVLI